MGLMNWTKQRLKGGGESGMTVSDPTREEQMWLDWACKQERRERRRHRRDMAKTVVMGICLVSAASLGADNWAMGKQMAYLAQHPTILTYTPREDGHALLTPAEIVVTKDAGDHMAVARDWVRFLSRVHSAKPALAEDRVAARDRLAGEELARRFDAMVAAMPKADDGYAVHVPELRVTPSQWDEEAGSGLWHVRYRVKTTHNGKLESDVVKVMLVHTHSTRPRLGAENGVEVLGFLEPEVEQDLKAAAVALRR